MVGKISILVMFLAVSVQSYPLSVEDENFYYVDNGRFNITISKASGMIMSAKLKGSNFELVSDYDDYSLFFPEFCVEYKNGVNETFYFPPRDSEVESDVTINTDDVSIIKFAWKTGFIDTGWEYKFTKEKPFFVVTVKREVIKSGVYANAQQCVMYTPDMDDSYIVNYEGKLYTTMEDNLSSGSTPGW